MTLKAALKVHEESAIKTSVAKNKDEVLLYWPARDTLSK